MKFTIESAGGVASRLLLDGHPLLFDQPLAAGGADLGPSPLDVMLASIGACAHYFAAGFPRARKLPVEGLAVDIEGEKATDGPRRLKRVSINVRLPPGVPEEMRPRIEQAVRGCPVVGTLMAPPEVSLTLTAASR